MNERFFSEIREEEMLRKELGVSEVEYGDAVEHLLKLAVNDTSGSLAAAQLLLSLYNSYNYHMALTDLCCLDFKYLKSALIAIRGRTILSMEPHCVLQNGRERFLKLEELWNSIHSGSRYSTKD